MRTCAKGPSSSLAKPVRRHSCMLLIAPPNMNKGRKDRTRKWPETKKKETRNEVKEDNNPIRKLSFSKIVYM